MSDSSVSSVGSETAASRQEKKPPQTPYWALFKSAVRLRFRQETPGLPERVYRWAKREERSSDESEASATEGPTHKERPVLGDDRIDRPEGPDKESVKRGGADKVEETRATFLHTLVKVATFFENVFRYCHREMIEESEVVQALVSAGRCLLIECSSAFHRLSQRFPDLKVSAQVEYDREDEEIETSAARSSEESRATSRSPVRVEPIATQLADRVTGHIETAFLGDGGDKAGDAREEIREQFDLLFQKGLTKVQRHTEGDPLLKPLAKDPDFIEGIQSEIEAFSEVFFSHVNASTVRGIRERALCSGAAYLQSIAGLMQEGETELSRTDLLLELSKAQDGAERAYRELCEEYSTSGGNRGELGERIRLLGYQQFLSGGMLVRVPKKGSMGAREPTAAEARAHEIKFLTELFLGVIETLAEERELSLPPFTYRAMAEQVARRCSSMLDRVTDQSEIDYAFRECTIYIQDVFDSKRVQEKVKEMAPVGELFRAAGGEVVKRIKSWWGGAELPADEKGKEKADEEGETKALDHPRFISDVEADAMELVVRTACTQIGELEEKINGWFRETNLRQKGLTQPLADRLDEKMREHFTIDKQGHQKLKLTTFNHLLKRFSAKALEESEVKDKSVPKEPADRRDELEPGEYMEEFFHKIPDGGTWNCWKGLERELKAWTALRIVYTNANDHPELFRNYALIQLEGAIREMFPPLERKRTHIPQEKLPRNYSKARPLPSETSTASSGSESEEADDPAPAKRLATTVSIGMEAIDFAVEQAAESHVTKAVKEAVRAVGEEFGMRLAEEQGEEEALDAVARKPKEPIVAPMGFDKDNAYYSDLCREQLGPILKGFLAISEKSAKKLGQEQDLDVLYDSLGRLVVRLRENLFHQIPASSEVRDAAELEAIEIIKGALERFDRRTVRKFREQTICDLSRFMKICIDYQPQLTPEERKNPRLRRQAFLKRLKQEGLLSKAISIHGDQVVQRRVEQDHFAGVFEELLEEIARERGYVVPRFAFKAGGRIIAAHLSEGLDLLTSPDTLDFALGHLIKKVEETFNNRSVLSFAGWQIRQRVGQLLRDKKTKGPKPRKVFSKKESEAIVSLASSLVGISGKAPIASSLLMHQRKWVVEQLNLQMDSLLPPLGQIAEMAAEGTLERVPGDLDDFFKGPTPPPHAAPCWEGLERFASLYTVLHEVREFWEYERIIRAALCSAMDRAANTWAENGPYAQAEHSS